MQPRQPSSKASVQAQHFLDQPHDTTGTAQGARRATEAVPVVSDHHASTEVVGHTKRRFKSNAEKRRIVALADACTLPGEVGLVLRREGIYSSNLSNWRQQIRLADASALDAKSVAQSPIPNSLRRATWSSSRVKTPSCKANWTKHFSSSKSKKKFLC